MKKYLLLTTCLMSIGVNAFSQANFIGTWQGKLNVGITITAVFNITDEGNGVLSGTMDSPDQGKKGMKCSNVKIKADSLFIEMNKIGGLYAGKMEDASHINGIWNQAGRTFPLNLEKVAKVAELNRPQTPKPPFDYLSEDVIYQNADKSIQYGATITIPKGKGPFPALVLITGSGLQNRDEEIAGHKPFAVIADYLTKKGYVVLRVDDRSMGQSTGDVKNATTADFAKDVNVSMDYLKSREEVNKKKLGMLGHSEGGMIAPILASQRKDIDFIVLMAGPGEKITKLMQAQTAAIMESKGMGKEAIEQYTNLYGNLMQVDLTAKDKTELMEKMTKAVDEWKGKNTAELVAQTTGIYDEQSEKGFVDEFAAGISGVWFKYFLSCDPGPYLRKLSCKVLAINGSKDIQVVSAPNLAGIKASLAKSKSKIYEVKELPGLNHLFQTCTKCTVEEYGELEETMSPLALQTIGDWLDKNVK